MRLLRCETCHTIEQLPDPPKGVNPNNIHEGEDPLLDEMVARHTDHGVPHIGSLVQIGEAEWANESVRKQVLERLGIGAEGLGAEIYDLKDTFHDDALKCFAEHNRPERCIDWKADSKKLGRPTREGQRFQKEFFKAPAVFLCDFCPVATQVAVRQREQTGRSEYDNEVPVLPPGMKRSF